MPYKKGFSLIELLIATIVLGIILSSGYLIFSLRLNMGSRVLAYSEAVNLANRLLEIRRASGESLSGQNLAKYVNSENYARYKYSLAEEAFNGTPLKKVSAVVIWEYPKGSKKEIRLVTLVE